MRLVKLEECQNDFQREYCYGDDVRQFFHPRPRKPGPFSYHLRLGQVVDAFAKYLPPPAHIGDLACAAGNFALTLAERGYKVTGVDLLEDFLSYARKKHTHGDVEFVQGNILDYRASTPLDGVLMGEVIEHVAWPEYLLQSAKENLRVGGVLVLTTPNGAYGKADLPTFKQISKDRSQYEKRQFHPGKHLFLYTPEEMHELMAQAGFEVLEVKVFNSHHLTRRAVLRYFCTQGMLRALDERLSPLPYAGGSSANMMIAVGRKK
jgi:2-polyprenyl-3-methyl-5-hydroxy-6-metoxy-1,4-benzoquinol methylase